MKTHEIKKLQSGGELPPKQKSGLTNSTNSPKQKTSEYVACVTTWQIVACQPSPHTWTLVARGICRLQLLCLLSSKYTHFKYAGSTSNQPVQLQILNLPKVGVPRVIKGRARIKLAN